MMTARGTIRSPGTPRMNNAAGQIGDRRARSTPKIAANAGTRGPATSCAVIASASGTDVSLYATAVNVAATITTTPVRPAATASQRPGVSSGATARWNPSPAARAITAATVSSATRSEVTQFAS